MTHPNDMFGTSMLELSNVVVCDETDETTEKLQSLSVHEETDLEDIPPSLLSYFESSKSRAVACEKLILEEPGDFFVSHHTEDTELHEDMMKHTEQVVCDPQIDENSSSTDVRLLHAPTETEERLPHNVSVCPNNEAEAGADLEKEGEEHSVDGEWTHEILLDDEEDPNSSAYEAERDNRRREEVQREEQRRRIENDFQRELKKIMEAEKLHQRELEMKEKNAQEKLEQELLLQQEVISSLQRRVKEERMRMEEEQKRLKDEEDKKRREEETIKREAEMRRTEGERRRREEEEMRLAEEERKRKEREEERLLTLKKRTLADEMRLMEEEERTNREDLGRMKRKEKGKMGEDGNNIEDLRKTENRKKKDEVILEKEERNIKEHEHLRIEKEKQITEEKRKLKEVRKRKEEESEREAERRRMGEEKRKMTEEEKKLRKEEERRNQEEERRRMEREEEEKERSKTDLKLEAELRIMKEEEEKRKKEELENIKMEKEENKRTKAEDANTSQKDQQEMIRKKEEEERKSIGQDKMNQVERTRGTGENVNQKAEVKAGGRKQKEEEEREQTRATKMEWKQMEEKKAATEERVKTKRTKEQRPTTEAEKRTLDDESKTKQEEPRRRRVDSEDYKEEEKDVLEGCDGDRRKVENENKTIDNESLREEDEERKNVKVEKEQIEEVVGKNRTHVYKETGEEVRLREEGKHLRVVEEEKEKGNKNKHHSATFLDEKIDKGVPESSDVSNTRTSSSPGPSHKESTVSPISTQQHDSDFTTSLTSNEKRVDDKNQAERPSSVSAPVPLCLPEHTEHKRLTWMKECVPWSKLSLQNKRKPRGPPRSVRVPRRAVEASSLPPLCKNTLLQTTGWTSLREVTTVTLEDLPGCSLSTLSQCAHLQSLTLRRCGLKSLESVNQLPELCYIDVQENDISFVDCENMASLRVLKLGHNKLTSIHGLTGAESLDVLELSHNSITRIAGLESLRRLQRLSLDHNQLISTKGLKEVYTLLHLSCTHNHLVRAEGLENCALLNTLDLRSNSLTEPPSLNNQVLLVELRLDDNSISCLQQLSTCWLPLIQHLSVAQNRITRLPSMSDFMSLANLDLRFNCLSELQNLCESLEGCHVLRELRLTGNPLQQESGWRPALHKAAPGLRAFDDQETDCFPSLPAVQQVSLASGSFRAFCQAQLQQTHDVQQQHSRELSEALSPLDALKTSCRHFTEALQLAEDQRFAHEYGDTTVSDRHTATTPEETTDVGCVSIETNTEQTEMEATLKAPAVMPNRNNVRCSYWTLKKSAAKIQHDACDSVPAGLKMGFNATIANSDSEYTVATKSKRSSSSDFVVAPASNHQDLELQGKAAVVIQQMWRKYRQKCGYISSPSTAEKREGRGGGGGNKRKPQSGASVINRGSNGQDYAATVIQAVWRGFTLRRRLTSALAAVTHTDTGEDDTFEEVDMDEFVFDEAALEKHWTTLCEEPPPRCCSESEQQLSLEPLGTFPEASQYMVPPPHVRRSKQAWVDEEQVVSAEQRVSPVSSTRSKSPASTPALSGLTERSEKILEEWGFTHSHTALLMLKRAQKMKSKKQQPRKNPTARLTLFSHCSYQMDPVGASNRRAKRNRNDKKVVESELGLQQADETERGKQAVHWDRDSESVPFLPEISTDLLHGGRVQLVADLGYTERQHHASGLWANSSVAARPCRENNYPHRNSVGHAKKEPPAPKRVCSAPSKKERTSFRDNPVTLSGGWGGGKKRDKVFK